MLRLPTPSRTSRVPVFDLALLALAVGFAIAFGPTLPTDAAALDLRLAESFANGRGMSFDGGDLLLPTRPLFVLAVGALRLAGTPLEAAAMALGVAAFAAVVWSSFHLASLLGGRRVCGALAAVVLVASPVVTSRLLDGSGTGLALALLALAAVAGVHERSEGARSAPLSGAAALAGLDTLTYPAALFGAVRWREGRWLGQYARTLLVIVAAGGLVALLAFDALAPGLPRGAGLGAASGRIGVLDLFFGQLRFGVVALALAYPLFEHRHRGVERAVAATLGLWALFGAILYALPLGDPRADLAATSFTFAVIVLAASTVGRLWDSAVRWCRPRAVSAAALLLVTAGPGVARLAIARAVEPSQALREQFDADRRTAGRFVARFASPVETVETDSAWGAVELRQQVRLARPGLTVGALAIPPAYLLRSGEVGRELPRPPRGEPGYVLLRVFDEAHRQRPSAPWVALWGAPGSLLARSGIRSFTAVDLPEPSPVSEALGLADVGRRPDGLWAHPPSGAVFEIENRGRPVLVRFLPSFVAETPLRRSDGVTFELYAQGELVFQSHVRPESLAERVAVRPPGAIGAERLTLAFVTRPGPRGDRSWDWSIWRDLRVVVEGSGVPPRN